MFLKKSPNFGMNRLILNILALVLYRVFLDSFSTNRKI